MSDSGDRGAKKKKSISNRCCPQTPAGEWGQDGGQSCPHWWACCPLPWPRPSRADTLPCRWIIMLHNKTLRKGVFILALRWDYYRPCVETLVIKINQCEFFIFFKHVFSFYVCIYIYIYWIVASIEWDEIEWSHVRVHTTLLLESRMIFTGLNEAEDALRLLPTPTHTFFFLLNQLGTSLLQQCCSVPCGKTTCWFTAGESDSKTTRSCLTMTSAPFQRSS